jgi:hypothetical protein
MEGVDMRRFLVLLTVCALALVVFTAAASAKSVTRPFKGFMSGQVVFTPDLASPSPWDMWTDSSAVGTVSHMGLTAMTSRHPTPETTDINGGNMRLVAANGAEVWITYSGYAPFPVIGVPSTIVVETDFTIVGGTGRFAHASGGGESTAYVEFPGVLDLGPWPAYWTWKATIRY